MRLPQDGRFSLTWTRARHWHKGQSCECASLVELAQLHLVPAGFRWEVGTGGNWLLVEGPGLLEGTTGRLFEAVSGRASWRSDL